MFGLTKIKSPIQKFLFPRSSKVFIVKISYVRIQTDESYWEQGKTWSSLVLNITLCLRKKNTIMGNINWAQVSRGRRIGGGGGGQFKAVVLSFCVLFP